MEEENGKILGILIDLLYDLPVCGCADGAIEELEVMDTDMGREEFIEAVIELYLDITCKTCSPDVVEELRGIVS